MNLKLSMLPGLNLPFLIANSHRLTLLEILAKHHEQIIAALNQQGAILFRGFGCTEPEYFSQAIDHCGLGERCSTKDYGLARTILEKSIYTSSDLPGSIPLPMHHEKPRSERPPNHLYFCCAIPSQQGGATLFADAEAIWLDIPKVIQNKVREQGVRYKQFFSGSTFVSYLLRKILGEKASINWQDYFAQKDKLVLEEKLEQAQENWQWTRNNKDLILTSKLPGVLRHPVTQRICWFNSADYLNYHSNFIYGELKNLSLYKAMAAHYLILKDRLPIVCHYGNGQAFSADEVETIQKIIKRHSRFLNWEKGDFMIVDNYKLMHGKQAHEGKRLLYSCMTIQANKVINLS